MQLSPVLDITVPFAKEMNSSRNRSGMQAFLWRGCLPNTVCTCGSWGSAVWHDMPFVPSSIFIQTVLTKKRKLLDKMWAWAQPSSEGIWGKVSEQSVNENQSATQKISYCQFHVFYSLSQHFLILRPASSSSCYETITRMHPVPL